MIALAFCSSSMALKGVLSCDAAGQASQYLLKILHTATTPEQDSCSKITDVRRMKRPRTLLLVMTGLTEVGSARRAETRFTRLISPSMPIFNTLRRLVINSTTKFSKRLFCLFRSSECNSARLKSGSCKQINKLVSRHKHSFYD
jgi:hypothetical protein